jgi:hypothetical protein
MKPSPLPHAKPGRITITHRHNGRFYLGADARQFAAIYSMILTAEHAQVLGIRLPPEGDKVLKAFRSFVAKIKAKAKSPVKNP